MTLGLLLAGGALTMAPLPSLSEACDLHLFALDTAGAPQATGNAMVRPLAGSDDPLAFINVMSPHDRLSDLSDAQYRTALRLGEDTAVVRHWGTRIDASVRKATAPLERTIGRCHHELVGYSASGFPAQRSSTGRADIYVNLLFRTFSADGALLLKVDKGGNASVDAEERVGREAALASLRAASVTMLEDFGQDVVKARTKAMSSSKRNAR